MYSRLWLWVLAVVIIAIAALSVLGALFFLSPSVAIVFPLWALAAVVAILLGPPLGRLFSDFLIDTIYAVRDTGEALDPGDVKAQRRVKNAWRATLALFYLAMLAGLYGLYWGWPGILALAPLAATDGLLEKSGWRAIVFIVCAIPWGVFLFGYFLPVWWAKVDGAFIRWRYGAPEPYDYDGSRAREAREDRRRKRVN